MKWIDYVGNAPNIEPKIWKTRQTGNLRLGKEQARVNRLNGQKWDSKKQNTEDTKADGMVNFMCQCRWGHGMPRELVKHFLDVSVRLLPKRLAFKSEEWVNIVLTNAGGHHPIHWGSKKKKGGGRENLLSVCPETSILLFLDIRALGSRPFGFKLIPLAPHSSGLWTQTELYHQLSWSSTLQRADCGTSWPLLPYEPLPAINLFSSPLSLHTVRYIHIQLVLLLWKVLTDIADYVKKSTKALSPLQITLKLAYTPF